MRFDIIAKRLNLSAGESVINAFQFLQADNIGLCFFQPAQHIGQARLD